MAKTCKVPGCTRPVHINAKGRQYARCHHHMKEYWRSNYNRSEKGNQLKEQHHAAPERDTQVAVISAKNLADMPAGCVQVVYPCAAHTSMIYLNATVDHIIPMPDTAEEMRELIKQHADDGILLAVEVTYDT